MDVHFAYTLTSWFIILGHILKNVPYVHENNVCSAVIVRSVLYISLRSNWLIVLSKPSILLLIFCLVVLSFIEIGVGKSSTLIIQLSTVTFYFMYFEALFLSLCMFIIVIAS